MEQTISQFIREHILTVTGVIKKPKMPTLEELKGSEWSEEFETLMKNRLIIGAFRYGIIKDKSKAKGDKRVKYMQDKLQLYVKDGNAEHLIDIANFCLVEFREENHPNFHFSADDDVNHMT